MPSPITAVAARAAMVAASPLPLSYDGSTLRFSLALSSMLILTCGGAWIAGWMAGEMRRCIKMGTCFPWDPLFALQLIFFLCGTAAFLRSGPEAVSMLVYREQPLFEGMTTLQIMDNVVFVQRWLQAGVGPIGIAWMSLVYWYYPRTAAQMVRLSHEAPFAPVPPKISRVRLWRGVSALALIVGISLLVGVSKKLGV